MSANRDQPSPQDDGPDEGAGVLGNLPRSRPAVRSPRRSATPQDTATEPATSAESGESTPVAATGERPGGELEALARAGIGVAGEAASLGLRIAGRAAAALRGAVERR